MGPPDYVIEPMGPTDDYEDAFRSLKGPPKYSTQELLTLQRQNQKYPLLGRFLGASFPDLVFGQNLKLGVKVKENPFGQKGEQMPGYRGYNYYQRPIFGPNRHGYRYGEYLWEGDLYPSKPYSHGPPKYSGYRQWTKAKDSKENNPISAQSEESKESNPKWDKPKWDKPKWDNPTWGKAKWDKPEWRQSKESNPTWSKAKESKEDKPSSTEKKMSGYRYGEYLWKGALYPSKPYSHGPPKYSGYRQWTKAGRMETYGYKKKASTEQSDGYGTKKSEEELHRYGRKDSPEQSYGYGKKESQEKTDGYGKKDSPEQSYGYGKKESLLEKTYGNAQKDSPEQSDGYGKKESRAKSYGDEKKASAEQSYGYGKRKSEEESHRYGRKDSSEQSYGYGKKESQEKTYGYGEKDSPEQSHGYGKKESPEEKYGYGKK